MKKLFEVLLILVMFMSFAVTAFAESEEQVGFLLAAPSGAPALAVATLAAENPEGFRFVAADAIAAEFAGETADFVIAPINAGADRKSVV